jgi:hypothetical protein
MRQQTYRRLSVLLVSGVIVAMIWLLVGTGCDGTPKAPDKDEVRRRQAQVRAGSPASNPPVLTDNNWKAMSAGDSVRTDTSGEAELRLVGCDGSVYVFDNSTLSVWTCTKKAEANKEYWCTEEGTAGFNISCSARFDVIDTPSAQVNIKATAFSVTYLPGDQLTLVTVLRGVVTVAPVLDMSTLEIGVPVPVEAGYFLYTTPGVPPEIGGVPAREARPLYELPGIVYELGIRSWMDDVTRWAETEQLLEPSWPFQGVTINFGGGQLADSRVQLAFVSAVDQEAVFGRAFPNEEVRFTAIIDNQPVDAATILYNPDESQGLLDEASYEYGQVVNVLFPQEDDQVATAAKLIAGDLSRIDISVELAPVPMADLGAAMREFAAAANPFIVIYR